MIGIWICLISRVCLADGWSSHLELRKVFMLDIARQCSTIILLWAATAVDITDLWHSILYNGLDLARGSPAQRTTNPVCFVYQHGSQLISMECCTALKQCKLLLPSHLYTFHNLPPCFLYHGHGVKDIQAQRLSGSLPPTASVALW